MKRVERVKLFEYRGTDL